MQGQSVSEQFRAVLETLSRMPGTAIRRVIPLTLAVTVAAAPAMLAVPADAASSGSVYVVQGLPGKSLDISIDGHSVVIGV